MKKLITAILLLMSVLVWADSTPVPIESPAGTGMNSNSDLQEVRITDATYLQNVNAWAAPGLLRLRYPIKSVGDNNQKVLAAFGYFDFDRKMKQIVAVSPKTNTDTLYKGFQGGAVTTNTLATDTMAVWIRASNRFETGVQDTTIKIGGFLGPPPYNAVNFDGGMFITSNGNVPLTYYPYEAIRDTNPGGAPIRDGSLVKAVSTYAPRASSVGLEAPGQLRVGIFNASGLPSGNYRYAYGYYGVDVWGLASRWLSVDSQKVFVTLFEAPPDSSPSKTTSLDDTATTFKVEIIRQKEGGNWYRLDTFTMKANQAAVYIDNNADYTTYNTSDSTVTHIGNDQPNRIVYTVSGPSDSGGQMPGGLVRNVIADTNNAGATAPTCCGAAIDTTYYFTYTYYNPLTGQESPFGPIFEGIVKSGAADGCKAFAKCYTKIKERAPWIRVYRGEKLDSMAFYGVVEFYANDTWLGGTLTPSGPNPPTYQLWNIFPGLQSDAELTVGDDASCHYTGNYIFNADDGSALVRPPYIEQLEIGFTDLAYANGRFWGIGDPLFPARVYYSHYDNPYEWSGFGFFPINENEADELVALEVIAGGNQDVIVALKHNSMYELSGYDPEYDLTWRTVSDSKGAISNRTVTSLDGTIYFLAMDMRVYAYRGGEPVEISQPIENYIDTFFTNATIARTKAIMFAVQDKIVISDTANSRALVYVPSRQWWAIEDYPDTVEFIGSFNYNQTEGNFSADQFDYWMYQGGVGEKFITQFDYPTTGAVVDSINGVNSNVRLNYRTPYIGDGEHLYQISKVDISGRWPNGVLRIRIIDGRGVQLDSTGATDAGVNAARLHSVIMPPHESSYLALEFADQALVQRVEIHKVVVHYKRIGRVAFE